MRYRLMATYRGVPYEAGIGPADGDVVLFAACPPPEDLGFEPATGHWRKELRRQDVQALWESRPTGSFRGDRCIVLDDLGDRLHVAYLGHDAYRAEQLGYWEVDRGVFEMITPREEITDIVEDRVDFPQLPAASPAPGAAPDGHAGTANAGGLAVPRAPRELGAPRNLSGPLDLSEPRNISGPLDLSDPRNLSGPRNFSGPLDLSDRRSLSGPLDLSEPRNISGPLDLSDPLDLRTYPDPGTARGPTSERPLPLEEAARLAASARLEASARLAASATRPGQEQSAWPREPELAPGPAAPPEPSAAPPEPGSGRSRRRDYMRRRLATQRIFTELAELAAIPSSAFAVGEEVDGAMCLIQTADGFEVFNSADGARHEVRLFDDEESAYFYLFGVLAADAVRTGRLAPQA